MLFGNAWHLLLERFFQIFQKALVEING